MTSSDPVSSDRTPSPLTIQADPLRVRAMFAGHVIADSDDVLILRRRGRPDMLFFPREDVETGYLGQTRVALSDPDLGEATCYTWVMEGEIIEQAVCAFDQPPEGAEALAGRLCLSDKVFEVYRLTQHDLAVAPRAAHAHRGTV